MLSLCDHAEASQGELEHFLNLGRELCQAAIPPPAALTPGQFAHIQVGYKTHIHILHTQHTAIQERRAEVYCKNKGNEY